MAYITAADITDSIAKEAGYLTALTAKIALSDAEVEDMAERKGVYKSDICIDPVHRMVKNYAIDWVCREFFFDLIGKARAGVEFDVYNEKYKLYAKRLSEDEGRITFEVLTGSVDSLQDRTGANTGTLFIGG